MFSRPRAFGFARERAKGLSIENFNPSEKTA